VMVDEILKQTSPLQGNVEQSALPHRGKGIRRRELAALCRRGSRGLRWIGGRPPWRVRFRDTDRRSCRAAAPR
jgi:hypothetical protein